MDLYDQIVETLEAQAQRGLRGEMSGSALEEHSRLGIKTPDVRKLARRFSNEFRKLPWNDQVCLAQRLLEYGRYEAAHLGVFLLGLSIDDSKFVDANALDSLAGALRGWSVTDAFCIEVLQPLLERFIPDVLSLITSWATAESRWKRRASVVVFVRKIGASGRYTSHGLRACERLIANPEDLVRKGVGWALKDLMRGDRDTVLEYVVNLRRQGVSSVITLYAIRDIRGAERQRVLATRP